MKRLVANLIALGIWFAPVAVGWNTQVVMAQTLEAQMGELFNQSIEQVKQGKLSQSIETLQQLLLLTEQHKNQQYRALALLGLGNNYRSIGKSQLALESYQQALKIFQQLKDPSREATTLNNIGAVYRAIGKPQEALQYYQQALLIEQQVGNRSGEATTLNNIGIVYDIIGKPKDALKYYHEALSLMREVGNRSGEARTLTGIGEVYRGIGKPEAALQYYQQALPIQREVGDRSGEAITLNNIGAVYGDISKPEAALQYYQQALLIQREVGDRSGEATTLNNIGAVYGDIGKPEEELKYYSRALPILREVGNRSGEGSILNNIGLISHNIGKNEIALQFYNQSLAIRREVGDRSGEASTLNNIGAVYDDMGKPKEALQYYHQALPILREIGDRPGEATILNNIAIIYRIIGKTEAALQYYNQSLSMTKEVDDHFTEAMILSNIGAVYRDRNQLDQAIRTWKEAIAITLDIRKGLNRHNRQAFIKANENTAVALVDLLINQKQYSDAFTWTNLFTTFDLAEYNRLIDAKVADPEAQKALDTWNQQNQQLQNLRAQLAQSFDSALAQQIRDKETQVFKLAETTINRYPEVAELLETKPTDITQLQKSIPANTVVLQPVLLKGIKNRADTMALFAVTSKQIQVIHNPLPKDFEQLIDQYRQQLETADSYLDISSQIYDILIRPLEQEALIPANSNIAIIATGKLREIPFETLYDSQNDQYLLEKYPIHYLTRLSKAQNYDKKSQNMANKPGALVLANPLPSRQELKNTELEADYLLHTFPNSEAYKNQQATIAQFKLRAINFPILHLGTHGCFQADGCPNLGMQANTLLFANNEQYKIADAALLGLQNTELLIIGACQTAKITTDEEVGLTGLAYIWERAGAKTVVASLWSAPDEDSGKLMKLFYGNLKQGMSKAEALRQAKLALLREEPDGKHPFFWSPFILIGDGSQMGHLQK